MSVKVASVRLIHSSLEKYAGFYQQLLCSVSDIQELGRKLIYAIEAANSFRQLERVEELGLILANLPIKEHQLIGKYYRSVSAYRKGESERAIFEEVIEKSQTHRAKGLISLAAVETSRGDLTSGLNLYAEAMRRADNFSTFLTAARSTAIIKSMEGYHEQALKDLESLTALAGYANPVVYYNHLNSLAVEFLEVRRMQEAQSISKIVLASPYAFAYPEWRETAQEIALRGYKSRSVIQVIQPASENIVRLPVPEPSELVSAEPARILDYAEWKKKMGKENGEKKETTENLTSRDMVVKILNLTTQEGISDEKLSKIIDYVEKVLSEPD